MNKIAEPSELLMYRQDSDTDILLEQTIYEPVGHFNLTPREEEILHLIAAGKTNKEIAREICRVERTVEYHRNRLMRKLNARNMPELLKKTISMGIMPL